MCLTSMVCDGNFRLDTDQYCGKLTYISLQISPLRIVTRGAEKFGNNDSRVEIAPEHFASDLLSHIRLTSVEN